ncbi:MAG: helix-turn-helix domain-containing protein [Thermodesulfobacteriota bacterium]
MMKQFLTANQVGERLNCKASTIYAWATRGAIPSFKLNGLLRFDQADIEEWIKECRVAKENMPEIKTKCVGRSDIDRIISGAIASVKGSRYNSPTKGKLGLDKAHKKGGR